ncbi:MULTISPECIES: hypothetical protein [Rhodopseudomonas]|uniref:hypothetical protein n=1 Tax=Rhodopseudomonas TaxID=1073 RepID=UPI000A9DD3FE|nr:MULTISPECIES: hypothetical protein [Rhodopseudomonas]MDF3810540.1 hypothetical protein [Rhodopseudomonas sp. BAL398]WOK18400.1 hypothetical protein RBJ75_02385 [Rhodopseudomonas sp. BAL398]
MATKTVTIPPVPLSESNGSMGQHTESPRIRGVSDGSMGHQTEVGGIPATSTVNGVKHVLPVAPNEPK